MPIRLDRRLNAIASLVLGRRVCDVGSDHGKLACYLVQTGRAEYVVATDISAPSLRKAETEKTQPQANPDECVLGDMAYLEL